MLHGWYQVAFEREVADSVAAVPGPFPLAVVRKSDAVVVIEATCPHRGAHLGIGGTLSGDTVICPFHGKHIGIGRAAGARCVVGLETTVASGLVFARFGGRDRGLAQRLAALDRSHYVTPGFSMRVRAPASLVIENGFDAAHFRPVHGVLNDPPVTVQFLETGELHLDGRFVLPGSAWQRSVTRGDTVTVPFSASAYSPGLVIAEFGGTHPYTVITAAMPLSAEESVVRLSVAVPGPPDGRAPDPALCRYLVDQSRSGIESDAAIWQHLSRGARESLDDDDESVRAFREFVQRCVDETE